MIALSNQLLFQLQQEAVSAENMLKEIYFNLPENDPRVMTAMKIRSMIDSGVRTAHRHDIGTLHTGIVASPEEIAKIMAELEEDKEQMEVIYVMAMATGLLMYAFFEFAIGIKKVACLLDPAVFTDDQEFKDIFRPFISLLIKSGWHFSAGDPIRLMILYNKAYHIIEDNAFEPKRPVKENFIEKQVKAWEKDAYCVEQNNIHKNHLIALLLSNLVQLNLEIMSCPMIKGLPQISVH